MPIDLSRHHAFVTAITRDDDDIALTIEAADAAAARQHGVLRLTGLQSLTIDGRRAAGMAPVCDEGRILRYAPRETGPHELRIAWRDYAPRRDVTHRYRISCAAAQWISITPGDGASPGAVVLTPAMARARLRQDLADFDAFAAAIPPVARSGAWTELYPDRAWLIRAFLRHIDAVAPAAWTADDSELGRRARAALGLRDERA